MAKGCDTDLFADKFIQEAEGPSPWRFRHRLLLCPGQDVAATAKAADRADLPFTALSLGVVAALHELSAILYAQGGHLPCCCPETLCLAHKSLPRASQERAAFYYPHHKLHYSPGLASCEDAGSCSAAACITHCCSGCLRQASAPLRAAPRDAVRPDSAGPGSLRGRQLGRL